jgi:hypothetical protein
MIATHALMPGANLYCANTSSYYIYLSDHIAIFLGVRTCIFCLTGLESQVTTVTSLSAVRGGHALGPEQAKCVGRRVPGKENGYLISLVDISFRYFACSLLFPHHINMSAPDPSRVSERLEPSHGDSPRVALSAATVFIASRASYRAAVQEGQAGPFYLSFLWDITAVFSSPY